MEEATTTAWQDGGRSGRNVRRAVLQRRSRRVALYKQYWRTEARDIARCDAEIYRRDQSAGRCGWYAMDI